MVDKLPAALQMEMETEHLPRYNMRRAASRPPPSARTRVLAKPQTESTLVQTRPSGAAPQINDVVVALVQAAAAIAKEVAATGPEPLVAAVDIKHADLQQLVSSDLLLTLMPEAEPEVDAAVKDLDVESRPLLSVDADASPLDAKPCVGRTSPTDVISAATGWSVPSRSCAEPLTPILAPRASEQCKRWTPLIAHSFPKTVAPTPPASPLRLVAHVPTRKISFPRTVAPTPQASPLRLAHVSTRKIRTVAWEEHSKPKHVLDEDVLREGQAAATKHVSAADSGVELPWSFWQARH